MSLEVIGISKKYGDKVVVDNLNFKMANPGVYALLGTNGAGKTTSLRIMLNMLSKDSGQVLWNGAPLSIDKCNVGYLAEERGLYPKVPLLDQLIYFASLRGISKNDAKARITDLAGRLDVEEYIFPPKKAGGGRGLGRRAGGKTKPYLADQLSKGNQQKIQFLSSLLSDPELLILDEPLSGLDPVNTDIFKNLIKEQISAGKYLIMSSHQMPTIEEFCTDITILDKSKTVLQGNLNQIKKNYGRVNLSLKVEGEIGNLINSENASIISQKENEYEIKVQNEKDANAILENIVKNGLTVVRFDLREPSLHEIFVEKVGRVDHE